MINSRYVPVALRSLTEHYQVSLEKKHEQIAAIHIILFISLISLLVITYLVFWFPVQKNLARDVNRFKYTFYSIGN